MTGRTTGRDRELAARGVPWQVRRSWRRRCTARTSAGRPCRCWAVMGGTVCSAHGGSAPHVRAAATQRMEVLGVEFRVDSALRQQARHRESKVGERERRAARRAMLDRIMARFSRPPEGAGAEAARDARQTHPGADESG